MNQCEPMWLIKGSQALTGEHLTFPIPFLRGHSHPLGHGVQRSWPPEENVPGAQSVSVAVVVDGQNLPYGQTVQNWAFPTEYVPTYKKKKTKNKEKKKKLGRLRLGNS